MWQRIQTVFLIIVIISLLAALFLPIWKHQSPDGKAHMLYAIHYSEKENDKLTPQYYPYALTAVLSVAAITVAFIQIRKYKNRLLQMKLGALNSLFMVGTIASSVMFASGFVKTFQGGEYGFGLWLPGVAILANMAANFFIRRDEKLVRDSERLR